MFWILSFIAFWIIAFFIVDHLLSAPAYKGPASFHFDGKKFGHPYRPKARTFFDLVKWALNGDRGEWTNISSEEQSKTSPPVADDSDMAVTFVNHTTFLVQLNGLNILTDPIWSNRASPYSWIGPKRMRPPGLRFEDLPDIDLVLVSHNHYDHLDLPTVLRLKERFDPFFITPLGVGRYLNQQEVNDTAELDWWDEYEIENKAKITAVPARHFSGRGVLDRDKTLWCGYVLQTNSNTVYFAGDTAYADFFADIGDRFPSVDLALIPIGAYKPRWFMEPIHCDPDEAVKIHRDVGADLSIGMHFGTFPLADEGMDEPRRDLAKAREKNIIPEDEFVALEEGVTKQIFSRDTADEL